MAIVNEKSIFKTESDCDTNTNNIAKLLLIPTIMEQIHERKFTLHYKTLHSQLIPKVIYPKTSQTSYQGAVLTWINSVEIVMLALYR